MYESGPSRKCAKNLWEGATRPNALFLSVAVQLNSEALRAVSDWFANRLVIFNEQSPMSLQFSVQMLKQEAQRKAICEFLRAADISIADIEVATRQAMVHAIHFDLAIGKREETASEQAVDEVKFHHITEHGKAVFDLMDESSGTRNLLFLTGPILDILGKGLTLVVDELDTSLRTLLVQALVRLFHRPEVNTGGALPRTTPRCSMPTACSGAIRSGLSKNARIKVPRCIRCSTSARAKMKHWSAVICKGATARCPSCAIWPWE